MIKPESNAPSSMQPWVRTTDKQIQDLENAIARLQAATNVPNVDFEQNNGINSTFTFVAEDSGQVIPYATGMNFTGNVVADAVLDVGGSLTVGAPSRQELDPETGEPIGAIPNFEMTAGQFAINPVTQEEYYTKGTMHMTDSALNLSVNGVIAGDGLSIALSNSNQVAQTPVYVDLATGDGTYATYTIDKTDATLASYVAGKEVTVTGMNPAGYNVFNAIILSVDSSGADLLFVVENSESGTFVAPGGYVVISDSSGSYDGKLSVQGIGPDFAGITVNQSGIYAGNDAGNPATATAYVTPTSLKAPELAGDFLKINNTKISVSVTEPTSPANGDLWIDPTGSSSLLNATSPSFSGNLVARSLRSSFASAAARDASITAPVEGMLCYLEDVNQVTSYIGSAWYPIAGQMPRMHLKLNSTFSITNGSTSTVTGWTTISNNSTFSGTSGVVTVPLTGRYNVTFVCIHTANNTTGGRGALIALSSTGVTYRNTLPAPQSAGHSQSVYLNMNSVNMAANDTVTLQAYQNSGATNTLTTDTFFIIEYVGP